MEHTDCGLLITEPRHQALLAPIADPLPRTYASTRFADADDPAPVLGSSLADALPVTADVPASNPTSTASGR